MVRQLSDRIGSRREGRETALGLLYSADLRGIDPRDVLASQLVPPMEYAVDLVTGVAEHLDEIDVLIDRYSQGWRTDRMPVVDRALVRLAVFELGHVPSVPTSVILSEAVDLVGDYSTGRSSRFVNGLLSNIADDLRSRVTSEEELEE